MLPVIQKTLDLLKYSRPWQIGAGVAALAVIVPTAIGVSAAIGSNQHNGLGQGLELVTVRHRDLATDVPITGRLVFPQRQMLTFDVSGTVGEVLVTSGQEVAEGQVLARLKNTDLSRLQKALAQAELDLDAALDALEKAKEEFVNTPLEQAQFEEDIAKAQVNLDKAEDALADFHRTYNLDLAKARRAKATAEIALDDAQQALEDFDLDENQALAKARDTKASKELALDKAQDALDDFNRSYNQKLAKAQEAEAKAVTALDAAKDALSAYIASLGSGFGGDEDDPRGLKKLNELQLAVKVAEENLVKARKDLAELEPGPDLLELQDLQTAVALAQAELRAAEADLAKEEAGPDQRTLRKLQAAVDVAQADLDQANEDFNKLAAGPDPEELSLKQKEAARRREELADLLKGPDQLEVALREAAVAAAQTAVDEARKYLAGAVIRAPFGGVVSLVNVKVDDKVTEDSRVLAVVDPSVVEVSGNLDAASIESISLGDSARVVIDTLPGQELEGTVSAIAAEPRTERGVITYPVTIRVEVPEGVQVPVSLSPVAAVVLHQEKGVLLVPRSAVGGTSLRPVVRTMQDGQLEDQRVLLGQRVGSWVAILQGLEVGDQVVAAASDLEPLQETRNTASPEG